MKTTTKLLVAGLIIIILVAFSVFFFNPDRLYGKKEYRGITKDGNLWEKISKWFGYKLHLIVDATYELPVSYTVTKASTSDIKEGHEFVKHLKQKQPTILEAAETLKQIVDMTTQNLFNCAGMIIK